MASAATTIYGTIFFVFQNIFIGFLKNVQTRQTRQKYKIHKQEKAHYHNKTKYTQNTKHTTAQYSGIL